MELRVLTGVYGLYAGTLVVCLVSGFVPVVNCEAYLLWVSAVFPGSEMVPVVLLCTLGQMIAKCVLYATGRGLLRFPTGRYARKIEAVRLQIEPRRGAAQGVIFLSALSGIPPFYAVSILAGTLSWSFHSFVVLGTCGRLIRFFAVFLLPQLFKSSVAALAGGKP